MQNACRIALFFIMLLTMTACGAFRFPGVFKIDINQGNLITQEMLDKLKPGMSRNQVLFVVGSPMLADTFHAHRWDYYLSYRHGGNDPEVRHITLYFEHDRYTHHTGEVGSPLTFEKEAGKKHQADKEGKEEEASSPLSEG